MRADAQLAKVTVLELNGSEYTEEGRPPIPSRRGIPSA
jgi:hypothetical protein